MILVVRLRLRGMPNGGGPQVMPFPSPDRMAVGLALGRAGVERMASAEEGSSSYLIGEAFVEISMIIAGGQQWSGVVRLSDDSGEVDWQLKWSYPE